MSTIVSIIRHAREHGFEAWIDPATCTARVVIPVTLADGSEWEFVHHVRTISGLLAVLGY